MSAAPLPHPAETPDGGPRLYGVIDVLRTDRVSGWAIDRADAAAAVEVEILRDGVVVARARADRERRDLARGGVGTGRYGFSAPIEPPIEPGLEFTIKARARTGDGATAELRRAGAGDAASPDRLLLQRLYEELRLLASRPVAEPIPAPDPALLDLAGRLEVVQLRLEAALARVEPSPPPALGGVRLLAGLGLAVALGSLAIGLVSLLGS